MIWLVGVLGSFVVGIVVSGVLVWCLALVGGSGWSGLGAYVFPVCWLFL